MSYILFIGFCEDSWMLMHIRARRDFELFAVDQSSFANYFIDLYDQIYGWVGRK